MDIRSKTSSNHDITTEEKNNQHIEDLKKKFRGDIEIRQHQTDNTSDEFSSTSNTSKARTTQRPTKTNNIKNRRATTPEESFSSENVQEQRGFTASKNKDVISTVIAENKCHSPMVETDFEPPVVSPPCPCVRPLHAMSPVYE